MQQNKEEVVESINEESGEKFLDGLDSKSNDKQKITFQYRNGGSN